MFSIRNGKMTILSLMLLALVGVVSVAPGHAYATENAALEQEFQSAFEAMLSNPSDVSLTTRYAELAVKLGDYESAIPPLERLLMADPEQLDVRLEVGVLYFLLNSHSMAKEYLNGVKQSGKATPDQIKRADEYLAKM